MKNVRLKSTVVLLIGGSLGEGVCATAQAHHRGIFETRRSNPVEIVLKSTVPIRLVRR